MAVGVNDAALGWTRKFGLNTVVRTVLVLLALFVLFGPFIVMFSGAFDGQVTARSVSLFPKEFTLDNFFVAGQAGVFQYLLRSLTIAGGGLLLQMTVSILAAYAIAFLPMRFKALAMFIAVSTLMIPDELIAVPLSVVLGDLPLLGLSLKGSMLGVILPAGAWGFLLMLLVTFMKEIPKEIIEAARVDGVGDFRMLWQIVMPLSRPAIGVVVIFGFNFVWDQYLLPIIVAENETQYTLTVALRSIAIVPDYGPGVVLAGAVMALLPSLIVYLLLQNAMVRGITEGAVK